MFFRSVLNSHHGLAALLGFNSDTNIYNYCYLFARLNIVKFCSVLYYQVRLDNGVSMHQLVALVLTFRLTQNKRPLGLYTCYLTNHGMCTLWLHSNRNEEYIRSILTGHRTTSYRAPNLLEDVKASVTQ